MTELIDKLIDGVSVFCKNYSTQIFGFFCTIIGSILVSAFVVPYINRKRQAKEAKTNKKQQLDTFFQDYLGGIYIPMNVTEVQPDNPKKTFSFFEHFAEIIQKRAKTSRYICLLGDIGTGKTAALVHLHQWYIEKYSSESSMPSHIRLYTLYNGYQKLLDRIDAEIPTQNRGNCILLLDALDECEEARASLENTQENNPREFMEKLGKDTEGFAWVVVSCRRQFFQSKEFQPGMAKAPGGKRDFGSFPYWQELILEPFNYKQVLKYLYKRFGINIFNPKTWKAIKIVYKCKDVFLRPLILSNIDVILEECHDRENLTMKEILDAVILNWISREAEGDKAKTKELLNISLCTAAYMYKHKLNYLNDDDYKKMCKEHRIDDSQNLRRVKSLLTNDKEGFRFPHQSFYEHLLAYWFFLNPKDIDSLQGMLEIVLKTYLEIAVSCQNNDKVNKMTQMLETNSIDKLLVASEVNLMSTKILSFCLSDNFNRIDQVVNKLLTKTNLNNSQNINAQEEPELLSDDKHKELIKISEKLKQISLDLIKSNKIKSDSDFA